MGNRDNQDVALVLCYKDFAYWTGYSSVGLNVAAITTAAELAKHGVDVQVLGVKNNVDLCDSLCAINGERKIEGLGPITNCVIMAPWLSPLDLQALARYFTGIEFTVQSHCNVAALHGDYRGIGNFRNYADLMNELPNLSLAGNSASFADWFSETYVVNVYLLPDLYPAPTGAPPPKPAHSGLNLGAFGALRPEKNIQSACAAALLMQQKLQVPVNFHMNVGGESRGREIVQAIDQMSQGVPGFTVIKHKWMPWSDFTKLVATMDLLLQPSFTESFNVVTADGVYNFVPSVVSPGIQWAPDSWKADPDDPTDIVKKGIRLLADPEAWAEGKYALKLHDMRGSRLWLGFLYPHGFPTCQSPARRFPRCWGRRMFDRLRKFLGF